jgi:hypothetical protein
VEIDPYRARLYRLIFLLAAAYNLAFALWAGLRPLSFFDLLGMDPPRYPAIWACLGMVVGVYGLGYAYAALRLDRALPFIALGFLGKILGPIGWVATVASGEWPPRTFTLILFNDLVWWLPFALFLLDATPVRALRRLGAHLRASTPYACAALNALAAAAMALVLRPGIEVVPDPAAPLAYIAAHPLLWRGGWALWIAAALSLLAYYAWWGSHLPDSRAGVAAFALAVAGLSADLLAESLYIGWLPEHHARVASLARVLTGGVGNGLYTLAGILLTLASPWLRGWGRRTAWIIWAAGLALAACSFAGSAAGMAISTTLLFALFCPWAAWMGWSASRPAVSPGAAPASRAIDR